MALQSGISSLLSAQTATTSSFSVANGIHKSRAFQANGSTSSGSGAATVVVQVSTDKTNWINLGTISLTLGTASTSDGFVSQAPWPYVRGNITAISGTGATVSLNMAWLLY